MAPESRRESLDVSAALFDQPERFEFFQAVRLLERIVRERLADGEHHPSGAVGHDVPPERELVRFRALPALSFPTSSVVQVRQPPAGSDGGGESPPTEMVVAFLGLTGPCGVLPQHYTALLLQRLRDKDFTLRDFLDLFHHRIVSLFYRAWEKYRLPFAHERFRLDPGEREVDLATWALYCLVGLGTAGLRGRLEVPDEAFLFYAGHFAHQPRSAVALECLLADYFAMPLRVEQLQGQWLPLDSEDQARMPGPGFPQGRNNRLGVDLVIGERVWDVQSKFRLRVGPLTFAQFRRLMPNGDGLRPLCQLTRTYVGLEFDFDVQVVLLPAEVPWCQLATGASEGAYLGWNTWARSEAFHREVEDAVFALDSI
jgi:type VI secretion system protein ImpH